MAGLRQTVLRSRFPEIIARLPEAVADAAARETAEAIERGAKERVPVDSGDLRDAIHVEQVGEGKYLVIAGDGEVYYGHMVENGTSWSSGHPPRPFLVPASEAERQAFMQRLEDALEDI